MLRDFVKELRRVPQNATAAAYGIADYERLMAGKFEVSIQASRTHYSSPRAVLPTADGYSQFEVAIFEGKKWIIPPNDPRFKDKPWASWFEGGDDTSPDATSVAGYVPRETVAQIIADLEAVDAA